MSESTNFYIYKLEYLPHFGGRTERAVCATAGTPLAGRALKTRDDSELTPNRKVTDELTPSWPETSRTSRQLVGVGELFLEVDLSLE